MKAMVLISRTELFFLLWGMCAFGYGTAKFLDWLSHPDTDITIGPEPAREP